MELKVEPKEMWDAPHDGTRVLLQYSPVYWDNTKGHYNLGTKWEEAWWVLDWQGQGRWKPWCGAPHMDTTQVITTPIRWMPLP